MGAGAVLSGGGAVKAYRFFWRRGTPEFHGPEIVEVPDGFISELKADNETLYDNRRSKYPVDFRLRGLVFTTIDPCHSPTSVAVFALGYDKSNWANP